MEKIVIKKGEGNALVVIDMQNDFVKKDGALYVRGLSGEPSMRTIIDNITRLIWLDFDRRICTKDEHPPEGHVEYGIFGRHCVKNTPGQAICDELEGALNNIDEIFGKGRNPYLIGYSVETGWEFSDHITELRNRGIKRAILGGLTYDYCVGESAIAYAKQGFETYVVRDATRSVNKPAGNARKMNKKLRLYGVKTIFMKDIE